MRRHTSAVFVARYPSLTVNIHPLCIPAGLPTLLTRFQLSSEKPPTHSLLIALFPHFQLASSARYLEPNLILPLEGMEECRHSRSIGCVLRDDGQLLPTSNCLRTVRLNSFYDRCVPPS
jgi:hypothetical protein